MLKNTTPLNSKGTIYLIEDDDMVRLSLTEALTMVNFQVLAFSSALQFYNDLENLIRPTVIVLDMQLPDMTGIELQCKLNAEKLLVPIIFISGESYPQQIISAMKQGAVDFLLKPFLLEELITTIDNALITDLNLSNCHAQLDSLTTREKEVFGLLAKGKTSKAVAGELNIAESTIKVHKSKVMEKLQVDSLQELSLLYHRLNVFL